MTIKRLSKISILILFAIILSQTSYASQEVPTLSEKLLYCTVRIETVTAEGNKVGTGFFFQFLREESGSYVPAIVTCKHVVKEAIRGTFHLTVKNSENLPELGNHIPISFNNFETLWIQHPIKEVDLCVMLIAPLLRAAEQQGKEFFYLSLNNELFPNENDLSEIGPFQDIVLVGYPIGIWDSVNNLPIGRQGVIATNPSVDYNGQKQFMIDAACFPGSSGSPVFLYNQGIYTKGTNLIAGNRLKFLGVLYGGPQYTTEGKIIIKNIPTKLEPRTENLIPANLGLVLKSKLLVDFEPQIKELINKTEKNIK